MPHCLVKDLPDSLISALRAVSYHKADVALEAKEKTNINDSGSQGRRGFVVLVNLETGENQFLQGSWGGSNAFNPNNVVDLDSKTYEMKPGMAVIRGSEGYGGTWASIALHPSNLAPLLPPSSEELSEQDRRIMYAFGCLKSGNYRKEELSKIKASEAEIQNLIDRGYLKKDGRGIQMTLKGKNSRTKSVGSGGW